MPEVRHHLNKNMHLVNNSGLVESDLKTPVDGLVSRVDYRGVNPTVWFLYLEMYGKDSAQDLCRRVCFVNTEASAFIYRNVLAAEVR